MDAVSTIVLARKYRPRNFAQMAGQEHVVRALSHALRSRRLHHAYLFTGTRGIGKTTVSRILAKSLNCTGSDGQGDVTDAPCGQCPACTQIDADRYIDYIELDAASNRSIDEVRDLIERAAYKPSVGRYKVFMIDEAHQLTKDAFNALLKTLEEPPEYLKFVLATTDPEKMLPTVLSRCLQFNLRPLAPEVVRAHLEQVLGAEGVVHDAGALHLLARAARGSMRDALSLTDQAIAYGGGRLEHEAVRAMLGVAHEEVAPALVAALAARDAAGACAHVQRLRESGVSAASTLDQMARLLQQMAVEQAVPGSFAEDDPDGQPARELAARLPPDETQLLYAITLQGKQELSLAPDEHAGLLMTLLRFHAFVTAGAEPSESAAPAPAPVRAAPLRASGPAALAVPVAPGARPPARTAPEAAPPVPAPAVPVATLPASPAPAVEPTDPSLGDRWQQIVARLAERGVLKGLVRELAHQGALVAIGEDAQGQPCWQLQVAHDPLREPAWCEKLREVLVQELGSPMQLRVVAGEALDSPARREQALRERRQRQAEEAVRQDPMVRELLGQFPTARIVPGSIRPV